jgi:hypothetical protein
MASTAIIKILLLDERRCIMFVTPLREARGLPLQCITLFGVSLQEWRAAQCAGIAHGFCELGSERG